LHDWEIFVGLAKAFAARAQAELKATMPPAQMIDYALRGALWRCVAWKLSLQTLTNIPMASTWGRWRRTWLVACAPPARRSRQPQWPARRPAAACAAIAAVPGELLLIGRRHVRSNNSWMHNFHRLVKGKPRHQLLMHPQDLASAAAGRPAGAVRSRTGDRSGGAGQRGHDAGVVSLPHGYGHGARACRCRSPGATGVSANDLTDERLRDGVSTRTEWRAGAGGGRVSNGKAEHALGFPIQCATVPTTESESSAEVLMDIIETIKEQIANNTILLYMKGSPNAPQCGFSAKASQAVMGCGEKFAYVDILQNPEIRANLPNTPTGRPSRNCGWPVSWSAVATSCWKCSKRVSCSPDQDAAAKAKASEA
jgi:hypothetical protein